MTVRLKWYNGGSYDSMVGHATRLETVVICYKCLFWHFKASCVINCSLENCLIFIFKLSVQSQLLPPSVRYPSYGVGLFVHWCNYIQSASHSIRYRACSKFHWGWLYLYSCIQEKCCISKDVVAINCACAIPTLIFLMY